MKGKATLACKLYKQPYYKLCERCSYKNGFNVFLIESDKKANKCHHPKLTNDNWQVFTNRYANMTNNIFALNNNIKFLVWSVISSFSSPPP